MVNSFLDQGKTVAEAAQAIAEIVVVREPAEFDRTFGKRVNAAARNIERRYREYKVQSMKMWSADPSGTGLKMAPFLFNGRPLPVSLALRTERPLKRGRPPKAPTAK